MKPTYRVDLIFLQQECVQEEVLYHNSEKDYLISEMILEVSLEFLLKFDSDQANQS